MVQFQDLLSYSFLHAAYTSLTMLPALALGLHCATSKGEPGQLLSAQTAFQAMTFFQIVSSGIQEGIAHAMEVMVAVGSLQRVGTFVGQNTWTDPRGRLGDDRKNAEKVDMSTCSSSRDESTDDSDTAVRFDKVSARLADDGDAIVTDVTFHVPLHGLTVIVGPTGSGKSTLLRLALGDLKPSSGAVHIREPLAAFCGQSPWIADISIRDNIVGTFPFNQERYKMALQTCALEHDLQEIADGDRHMCGLNGQSLSGGQKVRVVSIKRPAPLFHTPFFPSD